MFRNAKQFILNLDEFVDYFKYIRGLQFDEKPDYKYLNDLVKKVMISNNFYNDFKFDWCEKVNKL